MIGRRFETYAKLAEALTEIDETKARLFVVFFVEGRLRRGVTIPSVVFRASSDSFGWRLMQIPLCLET